MFNLLGNETLALPTTGVQRTQSRNFLGSDVPVAVEYVLASDASAIVEHTKKVLYLEDDDVAHISDGGFFVLF